MELVMCLSCAKFVQAFPAEGGLKSLADECPGCGGTEFSDTNSGTATDIQGK